MTNTSHCAKCGANDSDPTNSLYSSADLCAIVCAECLQEFNEWADANPGVHYDEFLPPIAA